jgi:hypothetical protein
MELSPSCEAVNCAATQELPSILWNPKVYYRVYKSPPLFPILSQINPILSYLSKMHFNIVHPPMPVVFPVVSLQTSSAPVMLHALPSLSSLTWSYQNCHLWPQSNETRHATYGNYVSSNKQSHRKLGYQKNFGVCWTTTWSLRHAKWNVKSSFMFWPFYFATLRRKNPQNYCESIHLRLDWRAGGLSLCPYQTFIRDSCPILSVMCLFM